MEEVQSLLKICVKIGPKNALGRKKRNTICAPIFMTLLKNAKNGQYGQHSIESTLLSQSLTVKEKLILKNLRLSKPNLIMTYLGQR